MSNSTNTTYISMMTDALKRKKSVLTILYEKTKEQEVLLKNEEMDVDGFEMLLEEKGTQIDELNKIDDGFDSLYRKLEKELMGHQELYREEIGVMKELITQVTEIGTKIQVLEKKNHERFQKYISGEREKVRAANKSHQTAMTYAQNMSGHHKPGDSYFVNETK